jgi:hypothetical protein
MIFPAAMMVLTGRLNNGKPPVNAIDAFVQFAGHSLKALADFVQL